MNIPRSHTTFQIYFKKEALSESLKLVSKLRFVLKKVT